MATRTSGEAEFKNLKRWLDNNQAGDSERLVAELEERIGQDYPAPRVLATNSCMAAMHIALQMSGIGPGDEVIVDPVVVFGGMAVMYHNAVPVFADIDPETFCMDPVSVRERVTEHTRAIICTQMFGSVCDMEALLAIAHEHNLILIEDCAHALFSEKNGKKAGLFGDFGCFSFDNRKSLSTGQGGFLLFNNEKYKNKADETFFGRVPPRLIWNYSMPGICAAIALAQWEHAKDYVSQDHALGKRYTEALGDCEWIIPQKIPQDTWSVYHIWAAIYRGEEAGVPKDRFMKVLRDHGGDYFLPSFMPYEVFGLDPSPAYRYPVFSNPIAYTKGCPTRCPLYEGRANNYGPGLCPTAEHHVPRMVNTVLSPIPKERIERYIDALHQTVRHFCGG